jgi:hypothetical protein
LTSSIADSLFFLLAFSDKEYSLAIDLNEYAVLVILGASAVFRKAIRALTR